MLRTHRPPLLLGLDRAGRVVHGELLYPRWRCQYPAHGRFCAP